MFRLLSRSVACLIAVATMAALQAEDRTINPVGYLRDQIAITHNGRKASRRLDLWFPTSDREVAYVYGSRRFGGQKGFAAEKGKVAEGKYPLIVFSHGFLGVSDQSIFLTEALARSGYIVAAMNHADAMERGNANERMEREAPQFADFESWTDQKFLDRREDVVRLIDEMLKRNTDKNSSFSNRVDEKRIGGMGHSLGGYTLLGMAGGWESWREPRLKSLVVYAPFAQPYIKKQRLEGVAIPVQMQGATLDLLCTPFLPDSFRQLKGPRELLVLKQENHFSWTNLATLKTDTKTAASRENTKLMVDYMIAFFDQTLKGVDRKTFLTAKNADLELHQIELNR